MPGSSVLHHLPEFAQIHVHWVGEAIQPSVLCHPLLLLPSIFPSIEVFSNESALRIRWPKYWSFSFSISPSNEYSGWISFRMDWFDLLAVQGTLKSLLRHHNSEALILHHSAFFMVQLLHLYMTIGKTRALTIWTFVGKVMSLLFNMLSRCVIAFLPRSKRLLISGLQSSSTVILEPKKIKFVTLYFFPICLPWSDETGCHDPSFLNVVFFFLTFHGFISWFICGCPGSSLLHELFSSCSVWRLLSGCGVWLPYCGAQSVGCSQLRGSRMQAQWCGSRAYLLCGMGSLPTPGNEPVSPVHAGGFFATEPPGKP